MVYVWIADDLINWDNIRSSPIEGHFGLLKLYK